MNPADPNETLDLPAKVAFRCSCGADVLLPTGGDGQCDVCGKHISLRDLSASQTVSFCGDLGSGTSFQLVDGPDRSGERLGHFCLIGKLGYGGMGAVYRALDESLQRFVAVKVIRAETQTGDGHAQARQVSRLLAEAVAQARLNHPNVVTIYYVGRTDEEPFLAMELLPGPTLGQLIEDDPLAYKDVLHYARQITSALAHATRLGLVHGDIKPSNLILSGEGFVKLGDFGLAKTEHSAPSKGISGTISYLAPELVNGGPPTPQSDMYSLGITLFELTFGRRPYPVFGGTLKEQVASQKDASIEFPEKWPEAVPEVWKNVLQRLLAVQPDQRYESYEALDNDLAKSSPVGFTSAGLLSRGLALVVDYALLGLLLLPFYMPILMLQLQSAGMELTDVMRDLAGRRSWGLLAPFVPLIATWFEWTDRRTFGRYLLQLRLVDAHGLRLNRRKKVIRSLLRLSPVWVWSLGIVANVLSFDLGAFFFTYLDNILLAVNTIPVLGPRRLALHDRLVGSHIVLDANFKDAAH